MDKKIYFPNDEFEFNKLRITSPTFVNGCYFLKIFIHQDEPFYIQLPKCSMKEGIIKGGKRFYTDLLFSNINEGFVDWIVNLEKYTKEEIFKNRSKWFDSPLEMDDIESAFSTSLKFVKADKQYSLRTTVPSNLGNCTLKAFQEDGTELSVDQIDASIPILSILEVKGIRCSSKAFQIEFEMKQILVVKPPISFDKCMISVPTTTVDSKELQGNGKQDVEEVHIDLPEDLKEVPYHPVDLEPLSTAVEHTTLSDPSEPFTNRVVFKEQLEEILFQPTTPMVKEKEYEDNDLDDEEGEYHDIEYNNEDEEEDYDEEESMLKGKELSSLEEISLHEKDIVSLPVLGKSTFTTQRRFGTEEEDGSIERSTKVETAWNAESVTGMDEEELEEIEFDMDDDEENDQDRLSLINKSALYHNLLVETLEKLKESRISSLSSFLKESQIGNEGKLLSFLSIDNTSVSSS